MALLSNGMLDENERRTRVTDWALERGRTPHKGDHKKKRRERRQTLDRLPEVKLFPTNSFCCFTTPLVQIIQIFPMETANGFPFILRTPRGVQRRVIKLASSASGL